MVDSPSSAVGLPGLEAQLDNLRRGEAVRRIWERDHTVWSPDPAEISDRLGWLTVRGVLRRQIPLLEGFAQGVRDDGFNHVVLLGMGGSSLGPEVLRQTFGTAAGFPELIVLDSTFPGTIRSVGETIDPARSLFLVSSKSGTTIEPNTLYAHFRGLVDAAVGEERAGRHFAAITDQGTPLARMAAGSGFRRAFLNPPDIGGRYSVLSYFGLVPAALIGMDLEALLDRADAMADACRIEAPLKENPGALLGAFLSAGWVSGRDKMTLQTPADVSAFGLWVEQMLSESLGKDGKGIVPVVGEPEQALRSGGADRLHIRLTLDDSDGKSFGETGGGPGDDALRIQLRDTYDLGGEFFRWEFATAVAGALMGVHPFDQPDVQSAKDQTDRFLESPALAAGDIEAATIDGYLHEASAEDYLAVLVYGEQTPALDRALSGLRAVVYQRWGLPTTVGYGPRYLHSTGQLHKGGANCGIFQVLTCDPVKDVPAPGYEFSFGELNRAQWMGDLQALRTLGRRSIWMDLGTDPCAAVAYLARRLGG